MPKSQQLKCYRILWSIPEWEMRKQIRTCFTAYSKEEAFQIFERWRKVDTRYPRPKIYCDCENISTLCRQKNTPLKKYLTEDYYEAQNNYIEFLETCEDERR